MTTEQTLEVVLNLNKTILDLRTSVYDLTRENNKLHDVLSSREREAKSLRQFSNDELLAELQSRTVQSSPTA